MTSAKSSQVEAKNVSKVFEALVSREQSHMFGVCAPHATDFDDAIPSCCKLEYEIGTIILAYKCDKNKTSLCILVF